MTAHQRALALAIIGTSLLDDPATEGEALAALSRAAALHPQVLQEVCERARRHLLAAGRTEDAAAWQERLREGQARLARATAERARLDGKTKLGPHRLSAARVGALRERLRGLALKAAHLCERVVSECPELPAYVLLLEPRVGFFSDRDDVESELLSEVEGAVADLAREGEGWKVVTVRKAGSRLARVARAVPGAALTPLEDKGQG